MAGIRKTRSDCTVGTFEKNMDYLQEQSVTKMVVIQEATKK